MKGSMQNWYILTASGPPPPPTPTVHFDNKSNMADGINDRELITIAHPDETLALQATQ